MAENGDTVTVRGNGTFDVVAKTATGGETFTHKTAKGTVVATGKWTAPTCSRSSPTVSVVGRDAGEVIHEAAIGMRFGATVHDFIYMVHVYPTMAEALKIVALSFFKDVEKMSCCAE